MHVTNRRKSTVVGVVAAAGLALSGLSAAIPATAATGTSVTINDPGQQPAGTVTLTGGTTKGSDTTSVLYVVDVTASSKLPASGGSCGDVNNDALQPSGAVGDVLDCELAAVTALNSSLLSSSGGVGIQVGVEAFGSSAAVADLSPAGGQFAPPGSILAGETQPRIINAATSVQHHRILRYNVKQLGTTGIDYNDVIATAQAAFATAPAGPKWVFLLSDGHTSVNTDAASTQATLTSLHNSGIHLSTFAVGDDSNCNPTGALAKLATATGEACTLATSPASLATQLTGSQPDGISGVNVAIGSAALPADINAIGGWSVKFLLGRGTYTATATAALTAGGSVSAARSFSVADAPVGGGPAPAPGTVAPGPGSKLATVTQASRPGNTRSGLAGRVSGIVGVPDKKTLKPVKALTGATVVLQGRASTGGLWTTVAHKKVSKSAYVLNWSPQRRYHQLRVVLLPFGKYAQSAGTVPTPFISGCTITKTSSKWAATCHTIVPSGSHARVLRGSHVTDTAKVKGGLVKVHGTGKPGAYVLVVDRPHKKHTSLAL
jgi:hypothetical protein